MRGGQIEWCVDAHDGWSYDPLARISKQRFKKVVDAIKADESSQLFVFIYGNERTRKRSFTQRRAFIIEKMKKAGIDPTRVTFEFSMHSFQYHKEMVILWLVPAGVSNPMP